jgi:hypothetical protein
MGVFLSSRSCRLPDTGYRKNQIQIAGNTVAGYQIPVTCKNQIQIAGKYSCRLPDTGYLQKPDTGCKEIQLPVTRYRLPEKTRDGMQGNTVAGYQIPVTGKTRDRLQENTVADYQIPVTWKNQIQVAGKYSCRLPDTGYRENQRQVAGKYSCRLPDTGYRKKPETDCREIQLPVTRYRLPGKTRYRLRVPGYKLQCLSRLFRVTSSFGSWSFCMALVFGFLF